MASEGQLRDVALWPSWDLPDPPPEHPFTLFRREGFCIGVFSGTAHVTVYVKSLPDDIDSVVSEVRAKVVASGARTGAWMIPEAAEPAGLREALIADYGMTPYDELPHEPRFAALLLTSAPAGHESPGLEARPVRSFEEFEAASAVAMDSFEVGEQDRQAHDAHQRLLWEFEATGDADYRTFVGLLDGEIVGTAALIYGRSAAYLVGGSTRSDARGRGVYRALCRARWDAAVARGTPGSPSARVACRDRSSRSSDSPRSAGSTSSVTTSCPRPAPSFRRLRRPEGRAGRRPAPFVPCVSSRSSRRACCARRGCRRG